MTTTIMIHAAENVTTKGVSRDNSNAITLNVKTSGNGEYDITLFGLPTNIAEGIEALLGGDGIKPQISEADIRADERRKIADELNRNTAF